MILSAGTRLGPHEILSLVGSGGMGEVYRARDTRLGRDVAIKILPPSVAGNPSRRARFHREAQAISQLNHPHICAVYDVGEQDALAYLVMEFIDGETLEHRLRSGRVPWPTAAGWSMQIASALDAAHRRGIVHRDLKPSNIMLAESGVKLLDFGIAKLLQDSDASASAEAASTLSLTAERAMVGTLQYSSPEQLEGRAIDGRTDIFSLGATLYEMLTARKAFEGSSPASITAAILTTDPPAIPSLDRSEAVSPAAVDHVLRRALAKDPDERWQTARDFMIEVRSLLEARGQQTHVAGPGRHRAAGMMALTIAVLAAVGGTTYWATTRSAGGPPLLAVEFTIAPPTGSRFTQGHGRLAISRDGRRVAFVAGPEGSPGLLTWQDLGASTQKVLVGTEAANGIFWSPDGEWIGYFVDGKLKRVAARGGTPEVVADGRPPSPAAYWDDDDVISFSQPDGWYRVKVPGGRLEKVSAVFGSMPRPLPGGRVMYLINMLRPGSASLVVDGPGLREPVSLPVDSNAAYAAGHLVYRRGETLVAQRFDPQGAQFTGPPVPLAENIFYNPANGRAVFDASDTMLAFRTAPGLRWAWRDREGKFLGGVSEGGRDAFFDVSPDSSLQLAFDRFDPKSDTFHIWVIDGSGNARQVSRGQRERFPVWSWNAQWIAFLSATGGHDLELRRVRPSGDGEEFLFSITNKIQGLTGPMDYGKDHLIFRNSDDLHSLPLQNGSPIAGATAKNLTNTPDQVETTAQLSPNGDWLVYTVTEQGQQQVWLQSLPEPQTRRQVTTDGGIAPVWREDGKELYYLASGMVTARAVLNEAAMTLGPPVALFPLSAAPGLPYGRPFRASHDGQRFLVSEPSGAPDVITVLLNWTARIR